MTFQSVSSNVKPIAKAGLAAKGIVYTILGAFAFMAAFEIAGQTTRDANREGVFSFIQNQTGGQIMLAIIALGLLCYTLWRWIQTFSDTEHKGSDTKGIATRTGYFFSGLFYTTVAIYVIKLLFSLNKGSGNKKLGMIQEVLSKSYGQWLIGLAALVMIVVGIYQIWYGFSGKYKEHVGSAGGTANERLLVSSGKIGYAARGIVWLIIGWMFSKAAFYSNASEAGDTSKAFAFLEDSAYGSYLLGAVGFGFLCYGIFNFIRARYERF